MILRISKILVMMALPIVLISCGGGEGSKVKENSGMRFVPVEGQNIPIAGSSIEENELQFGNQNFVGLEVGPIRYNLTNTTGESVKFTEDETGLVGGNDDIFIVGSSCLGTLEAEDSCEVSVTLSPKEQDRSYRDEYAVKFESDVKDFEAVQLVLGARTFTGELDGVEGVDGLSVSVGYDNILFENVLLGNTSPAKVVTYYYFGDGEIVLNATESSVAASLNGTATSKLDKEISIDSTCGLMRYGDTCMVQLFYKPAVPSSELQGLIYSHLPVKIQMTDVPIPATSLIKMTKASTKPDDSLLMQFRDTDAEIKRTAPIVFDATAGIGEAGTISDPFSLDLARTDEDADGTPLMFYRLESTNPAIQITRNQCNLLLDNEVTATSRCAFDVRFSSADSSEDVGYIMAVAGQERIFLAVKAEKTTDTPKQLSPAATSKTSIRVSNVALQADAGSLSATKSIIVDFDGTEQEFGKPFNIRLVGTDAEQSLFRYTTTCVDGKALSGATTSCSVDINYRGEVVNGDTTTIKLVFASEGEETEIPVTGTTVTSPVEASPLTPVKGLEIDSKFYAYPATGVGLVSSTRLIELTNNSDAIISGLGTTTTDLSIFSLNNTAAPACTSTLDAGKTCILGFTFNPRNTVEQTGYISIYDNRTLANLRNNEIIQVIGRGALFNEYLSFGVVAPNETKTLVAALTNDGISAIEISDTVLQAFDSKWETTDFVATKELATGNRVALIKKFFNQDNFTATAIAEAAAKIKIVSTECNGIRLDPGASCLVRVQFAPTEPVDPTDPSKNHYRAYVNFEKKDAPNTLVDRLHVIGSTQDNSTMYFHPLVDINHDIFLPNSANNNPFEDNESTSVVTLENQFVVIGNTMYSYLGTNDSSLNWKGDNKLRRYDASRNLWVILEPTGDNPFNKTVGVDGDLFSTISQSKMIAYDGQLYLFSSLFDVQSVSLRNDAGKRYDLYSYNPNFGKDGKWTNLGNNGKHYTGGSLAAHKGILYLFGGYESVGDSKVTTYDIAAKQWGKIVGTGDDLPAHRTANASIVVEVNRTGATADDNLTIPYLIIHGGSTTKPGQGSFTEGLNDLWVLELPYTDKDGETVTRDETYKWTQLQKNTSRIDGETDGSKYEKRPGDRSMHLFNYYDNKLFLSSGIDGDDYNGNGNKTGGVFDGPKGNYYILDPAKLFNDDDNTNCGRAVTDINDPTNDTEELEVCTAFDNYTVLNTEYLSMNLPATLSGDLWFHNWNILGVFFNKSLEGIEK